MLMLIRTNRIFPKAEHNGIIEIRLMISDKKTNLDAASNFISRSYSSRLSKYREEKNQ